MNYDFQLCPFCGNRSGTVYGLAEDLGSDPYLN